MTYEEQLKIEQQNKEILASLDGEALIEFYKTHNRKETKEKFGIRTDKQLVKALTIFGYDFSTKKALNKGKPSTRSHESYVEGGKKSAVTQQKHWEEKSDEEKDAWSKLQIAAHSSEETRQKISLANKQYQANLTDEERFILRMRKSKTMKEYWASLSPDKQQEVMANRFKNGVSYNSKDSKPNLAFKQLLEEAGLKEGQDFQREVAYDRKLFDFKINNILIEVDPAFTHNTTIGIHQPIDKFYHINKTRTAINHGFRCIHVFDWDSPKKILRLLLQENEVFYARNSIIKEISQEDAAAFINEYHLQNYARSKINLGLFIEDDLKSVMTFGKPRYAKDYEYELIRYCAKQAVVGGAEKLFSYFIKKYNPESIISYCDLSKFTGETYIKLGFIQTNTPQPSKHWYNVNSKRHITDNLLRQQGFDRLFGTNYGKGTSNEDLMREAGFVEIYDCGQATFGWHKTSN